MPRQILSDIKVILDSIPLNVGSTIEDVYNDIVSYIPNAIADVDDALSTINDDASYAALTAFPQVDLDIASLSQGIMDREQGIITDLNTGLKLYAEDLNSVIDEDLARTFKALLEELQRLRDAAKDTIDPVDNVIDTIEETVTETVETSLVDQIMALDQAIRDFPSWIMAELGIIDESLPVWLPPILGLVTYFTDKLLNLFTFDISQVAELQDSFAELEGAKLKRLAASMKE